MSDDPFADGGFGDDAGDGLGGDFGDSTNDGGDDGFGVVSEEQNNDDPFGEQQPPSNDETNYDMVGNEDQGGISLGGDNIDAAASASIPQSSSGPSVPEEEDCSALNAWRTEWRATLESKAAEASEQKTERRKTAEEERKGMAEARNKALEARAEGNRQDEMSFLEEREKLAQPGANPWERVVSLVDTQVDDLEKSKATERMRSILIQMKGQDTGPGIP